MKILTPDEVEKERGNYIPDYVFDAFNNLLIRNYSLNYEIQITQEEAIIEILKLSDNEDLTKQDIFHKHWLDIEPFYEKFGWIVSYYKPAIDERFKPYFIFKPKNK